MNNYVLFCTIFLLIFGSISGSISGEPDICEKIPKFIASKSKIIFDYNGKKYNIEEIQNKKGYGKLIVETNETAFRQTDEKEIYFKIDSQTKKLKMVIYHPLENKCTPVKEVDKSIVNNDHPYAFYDPENGIFGPSALWSLAQNNKFESVKGDNKEERGIKIQECNGSIELENLGRTNIKLAISDLDWKIYDQKDDKIPIKITIDAQNSIDNIGTKKAFEATIEYYFYENIIDKNDQNLQLHEFDSKEDYWIPPSPCDPLAKEMFNSIPKRVKMIVEELDEMQSEIDENKIKKMNLLIDNQNNLVRYQKSNNKTIEIYDSKNKVKINIIDKFNCTLSLNDKIADVNEDLLSFFNDIMSDDLKQIDGYLLIGEQIVRNEMTKVYRKKQENDDQTQINTLYVQEIPSELNRNSLTSDLMQMRIEKYLKIDSSKPTSSKLFNFYDFEYINKDEDLVRKLDVSDCIDDNEMITEFDLISINYTKIYTNDDTENPNETLEKQKAHQEIKKKIVDYLVKITGKNLIHFPKVEVHINSKEIISRIKFIDYIAPSHYFEKESEPPIKENGEPDKKITVSSEFECAINCLKEKESKGFQYCYETNDHYCYLLKTNELKVANRTGNFCLTFRKREDAIKEEFNYESIQDNLNKIQKSAEKDEIKLEFSRVNAIYIFNKLYLVKEQSKIDRSKLYKLKMPLTRVKKDYGKKLEIEEGITNIASCYEACINPKNGGPCDSFSFCQKFENKLFDCYLTTLVEKSKEINFDEVTEKDKDCNLYTVNPSMHFQPTVFKELSNFAVKKVESLDQCSTICDSEDGCDTFNYCETDSGKECKYTFKNGQEKKSEQELDHLFCSTFIHRKNLINPENIKAKIIYSGKGFKPVSVTGFVFLFLVIGIIVGAIGFYGQKFYLKRDENLSGGKSIAVNFSNLRDDV